MIRAIAAIVLLLAGCASPEVRCISQATRDLRVVNDLIDQTRQTIDRGYAMERVEEPRVGLRFCTGHSGNFVLCSGTDTRTHKRPVAVDLAAERAKLASLLQKKSELETRARREIGLCKGA